MLDRIKSRSETAQFLNNLTTITDTHLLHFESHQ